MKGENCDTSYAGATACFPSGKRTGQKVEDFHAGNTRTPLVEGEDEIFFQAAISDGGANVEALDGPADGKGIGGQRAGICKPGEEAVATSV